MTGLEKILQQIRDNGTAAADEVIGKAKEKANVILQEARTKAADLTEENTQANEKIRNAIMANARSGAEQEKRRAILKIKQDEISKTVEEAHRRLLELPVEEYFSLLIKLAVSNAREGEGEVLLNSRDLARMPEDFARRLNQAARPGCSFTVSAHPVQMDGGLILSYGGIEENCSFDSWFYAHREELQDQIGAILFKA